MTWSQLRHQQALTTFEDLLNSPRYKNPPSRVSLLADIRELQNKTQSAKLAQVALLQQMVARDVTADAVDAVRTRLEAIDNEDQAAVAELFSALQSQQEQTMEVCGSDGHLLRACALTGGGCGC